MLYIYVITKLVEHSSFIRFVYEYIDWKTLNKSSREYMENHIRIFSGLFGLLTPNTLIPNYKLKMNVLSLQYHWSPVITKELENEDVVFDLLPQVHRKAYKPSKNVIKVDLLSNQIKSRPN